MKLGKKTTHEKRYFGDPFPHVFEAVVVTLNSGISGVCYNAKSGWIFDCNITTIGKSRLGAGWLGFATPSEAAKNAEIVMDRAAGL